MSAPIPTSSFSVCFPMDIHSVSIASFVERGMAGTAQGAILMVVSGDVWGVSMEGTGPYLPVGSHAYTVVSFDFIFSFVPRSDLRMSCMPAPNEYGVVLRVCGLVFLIRSPHRCSVPLQSPM